MNPARDIDRICDEFEAAWQAGEVPKVEDFVARIDEEHRPALLAALMPLDLTYRGKLGETLDSGAAAGEVKPYSGFEVTLDSDPDGPKLSASSATKTGDRVKYFGEYELLSEIARGGMGVVYKARQVKLNRIVALKMILSGELAGSEAVQRFHSEAEAAANLDHPGIVPIYEIGEHGGQHYFSMGFIDGPSLQGKLNAGPMPAKEAARLCRKIAEAVAYAHSKNVIHRDLKPANVLIDGNGEPKVTDFGLAKKVEGDSGLTRTGAVMGTPSYMPPEQALGQTDKIGPAADVYSLGAILYCMLTGRPPFQAANVVDTLKQVIESEPVTPRTLDSKIQLDLETICLKCLEKNPVSRYASAQEFVDELQRFDKGEPIKARRISRTARTVRWCRRNPAVASFLAITTIMLFAVAGSLWSEAKQRKLAQVQTEIALSETEKLRRTNYAAQITRAFNLLGKSFSDVDRILMDRASCPPSLLDISWRLVDGLNSGIKPVEINVPGASQHWAFSGDGKLLTLVVDRRVVQLDLLSGEAREFPALFEGYRVEPKIDFLATSSSGQLCIRPWSPTEREWKDGSLPLDVLRSDYGNWEYYRGRQESDFATTPIQAACFSADDSYLVVANQNEVQLWSVQPDLKNHSPWTSPFTLTSVRQLDSDYFSSVKRIWLLPNKSSVLIADSESRYAISRINEEGSLQEVQILPFKGDYLACSGDSTQMLLQTSDEKLLVASLDPNETASPVTFEGQGVLTATFLNDSSRIAMVDNLGQIKELHLRTGQVSHRSRLNNWPDTIRKLEFSPDGDYVVAETTDGRIVAWRREGRRQHFQYRLNSMVPLAFSSDSSVLVIGHADGTIRFENHQHRFFPDSDSSITSHSLKLPTGYATRLAFSHTDQQLAVATSEGDLFVIDDPLSVENVAAFRQVNQSSLRWAAWELFYTDDDQELGVTLVVKEPSQMQSLETIYVKLNADSPKRNRPPHITNRGRADHLCTDNEKILVGKAPDFDSEEDTVIFIESGRKIPGDYRVIHTGSDSSGLILNAQITPDRRTLATSHEDGSLQFRDTQQGELCLRLNREDGLRQISSSQAIAKLGSPPEVPNEPSQIASFAIANDQSAVAISYGNGTVHLWPARESSLISRVIGETDGLRYTETGQITYTSETRAIRFVDSESFEIVSDFPNDMLKQLELDGRNEAAKTIWEEVKSSTTIWAPGLSYGVTLLENQLHFYRPQEVKPYQTVDGTHSVSVDRDPFTSQRVEQKESIHLLNPSFSNDGSMLVLLRNEKQDELVVYDASGNQAGAISVPEPVVPLEEDERYIFGGYAISNDGKRIVFETRRAKERIYSPSYLSESEIDGIWVSNIGQSETPQQIDLPPLTYFLGNRDHYSLLGFVQQGNCIAVASRRGSVRIWDLRNACFQGETIYLPGRFEPFHPLTKSACIGPKDGHLAIKTTAGQGLIQINSFALKHWVPCIDPNYLRSGGALVSGGDIQINAAFNKEESKLIWLRVFRRQKMSETGRGFASDRPIEVLDLKSEPQTKLSVLESTTSEKETSQSTILVSRKGLINNGKPAFENGGKILFIQGNSRILIFELAQTSRVRGIDLKSSFRSNSLILSSRKDIGLLAPDWDGTGAIARILLLNQDGAEIALFDEKLNEFAKSLAIGDRLPATVEAAISKDSKFVVTSLRNRSQGTGNENDDWPVIVWDAKTGKRLRDIGTTKSWNTLEFYGTENQVFISEPTRVRLADVVTGKDLWSYDDREYRGHHPTLPLVAFSRLASGKRRTLNIEVVNTDTQALVDSRLFHIVVPGLGQDNNYVESENVPANPGIQFSGTDLLYLHRQLGGALMSLDGNRFFPPSWGIYSSKSKRPLAASTLSQDAKLSPDAKFVVSLDTHGFGGGSMINASGIELPYTDGSESLALRDFELRGGFIKIHSVENDSEVGRVYVFDGGEWIVIDSDGRFDASSDGVLADLGWHCDGEVVTLDHLKDGYKQPGLLPILFGRSDRPLRPALRPDHRILKPIAEASRTGQERVLLNETAEEVLEKPAAK